jgi:hypothetical protein
MHVDDLEKLARLLAGRELSAIEINNYGLDESLRDTTSILPKVDLKPFANLLPWKFRQRESDGAWHARQCIDAASSRSWSAALFHLNYSLSYPVPEDTALELLSVAQTIREQHAEVSSRSERNRVYAAALFRAGEFQICIDQYQGVEKDLPYDCYFIAMSLFQMQNVEQARKKYDEGLRLTRDFSQPRRQEEWQERAITERLRQETERLMGITEATLQ